MKPRVSVILTIIITCCLSAGVIENILASGANETLKEKARRIHKEAIVIDSHSDTTMRMLDSGWDFMERHENGHVDYPRIREGGLDGVFLAVYMGEQNKDEPGVAVSKAMILFDKILDTVERNNDRLTLALSADDIKSAESMDKTALLIGVEGGHIINNSLETLRCYYRLGARYMTLTHIFHHDWADSAGLGQPLPPLNGGLTDFGGKVVREMNRLGMMVDISHVSDKTFWDVIEISKAPIVATHSGARALCNHPRNLDDKMIKALAEKGGVVQIVFFPGFLDPDFKRKKEAANKERGGRQEEIKEMYKNDDVKRRKNLDALRKEFPIEGTPISILIDHIEHVIKIAGPDHVGLGADWDGVSLLVEGLEDCSKVPLITLELLKRGHSEEVIKKILGGNLLRVMEETEKVSMELKGG